MMLEMSRQDDLRMAMNNLSRIVKGFLPISLKRFLRKMLRLEPFQIVMRKMRRKGINMSEFDALEVFGYTGEYHTMLYAPCVRSLEVWEIDGTCEAQLRRNLPSAAIKITDSYREITLTQKKFDLIVVDNPVPIIGGHCEHFDLFPNIFKITGEKAILIIDVIPEATKSDLQDIPGLFSQEHLELRRKFYKPADPAHILHSEIVNAYKFLISACGYDMEWHFFQRRTSVYYFVCCIVRNSNV